MDMFFHIASIEREVYWQLGNVTCSAYPLKYLDTIHSETGELQTMSALNLIVFGAKLEHLDLIEYVIVDLLKVKWKSFVKRVFYTQFAIFAMFFLMSATCFVLRENTPGWEEEEDEEGDNSTVALNCSYLLAGLVANSTAEPSGYLEPSQLPDTEPLQGWNLGKSLLFAIQTVDIFAQVFEILCKIVCEISPNSPQESSGLEEMILSTAATLVANLSQYELNGNRSEEAGLLCEEQEAEEDYSCFHHTYDTLPKQIRVTCEVTVVIWSILYLIKALHELSFLGRRIWVDNMVMCPSRLAEVCFTALPKLFWPE